MDSGVKGQVFTVMANMLERLSDLSTHLETCEETLDRGLRESTGDLEDLLSQKIQVRDLRGTCSRIVQVDWILVLTTASFRHQVLTEDGVQL